MAPLKARVSFANLCTATRAHERDHLQTDLRGALRIVGVGGRHGDRLPARPSTGRALGPPAARHATHAR